jgi:hypothetical protein
MILTVVPYKLLEISSPSRLSRVPDAAVSGQDSVAVLIARAPEGYEFHLPMKPIDAATFLA